MSITKRIAVVGSGVVGVNTLLRLIDEREPGVELVWIYDSKTPIFGIGESTTPDLPSQIAHSTNIVNPHAKRYFDATIKFGNKFIGWGKSHNFIRWLDVHAVGIHFDTKYFSEFFLEHLPKITHDLVLRDEKVTHIGFDVDGVYVNSEKYDFVMDCTGGKSLIDHDQYFDSPFVSVNSVLALRLPEKADWGVTITYAHENGWMFGIPLQSRRTFGYTFNDNITTEEEALKDFRTIIPEALGYPYKKFKWTPRLSKYVVHHSGRYARNGNAVGFIDPLESLAGMYYDQISNEISEFALNGDPNNIDEINRINTWYYTDVIDDWYKNMAWMYHFGSRHDTPFWRNMVADSRDLLNNKEINNFNILREDQNFTEDLWHIIADDPDMLRDFTYHQLDYIGGNMNNFARNYRDFVEFAYGMGASYAHKYPLLVPSIEPDEKHGELHFDTRSLK
tara:strand:+ start:1617 stop:2960 length:1344 start_codon:yes stop_codon:yes gene_type:complete